MLEPTRTCTSCDRPRAASDFPPRGGRCLDCRRAGGRAHYSANRAYYLAKARRRQVRVVAETREWLIEYLKAHPCVDCGESDIRVLEFDHRGDSLKVEAVGVLARSGYPLRRVISEVEKCDVRCANCHRRRTHVQRGWWGSQFGDDRDLPVT